MTIPFTVRAATTADAARIRKIYRPYVEETAISFELEVPSVSEMAARVAAALGRWSWLVATVDGEVAGYAYATAHRSRPAYALSVETSAYVDRSYLRSGMARALYTELFDRLNALGYCSAYAGITLPNDPSVAFHRKLGFTRIGVFPKIGYKFDQFFDVAWFYRPVSEKDIPRERLQP